MDAGRPNESARLAEWQEACREEADFLESLLPEGEKP
jgi:hypothetical protein